MTCSHCNGRVMVFDDEAACIACGRSPAPVVRHAEGPRDPAPPTPGQLRHRARMEGIAV